MHSPGLRQFRGAVSLWLVRHVCACGTVRCKVHHKPIGKHSNCVQWTKQGAAVGNVGEVLPAAETAEPELGPWSVFCESAATLEAKAGHHNPEQRSDFHKGIHARRENWLSARGVTWYRGLLWSPQGPAGGEVSAAL